jgi:hypothetical protein
MAGHQKSFWSLIAALTLAVLILHWTALTWLASQWIERSVLRPLAIPLFTRTLVPSATVARPKQALAAARKARHDATAATSAPAQLPVQEPEPEPVAPAPEVTPEATEPTPAQAETPPAAPADTWPANTRLSYTAGGFYRGRLWGDAQVQWQREGERYQVQLKISFGWLAHLSMTSQGQVTPALLLPEVFEEETTTARRHLQFTPQEIVLMNGSRLPRPEGVQDSASQFVALSHRFANAPTLLAVGQSVQFWLARPGGADLWTYDVVEMETLETPRLGAVQAFHLKPRPLTKPRGPITAEMWFAPALQYLPVRIKVSLSDEAWVDLLVDKIEQSDPAPPPENASPRTASE